MLDKVNLHLRHVNNVRLGKNRKEKNRKKRKKKTEEKKT